MIQFQGIKPAIRAAQILHSQHINEKTMKVVRKDNKNPANQAVLQNAFRRDFYLLAGILFILTFFYFLLAASHVPAFQEEQFLFLFSGEYFKGFLARPGGLIEYAGRFLMQFYTIPALASLELALILVLPGILMHTILKKMNPGQILLVPLSILPSVFLILMQNQYYHLMEYNLGYICILSYFLFTYRYRKIWLHIILLPLLYFASGAFALIYIAMEIVYGLVFNTSYKKIYEPLALILTCILSYFVFSQFLFLVPDRIFLTYPLPLVNERFHRIIFWTLTAYIILFPLLSTSGIFRKSGLLTRRYGGMVSGSFLIVLTAAILYKKYDKSISNVMYIQNESYKGEWDKVIKAHEKFPSGNLISQYFYNTALSEKGILCDRLFSSGQSFGTKALILPWGDEYLERGAYFFFTAGLVNEAHRWAYEEMVVYGMRPHNLQMLIRTSILDRNFRIAEKYINILKKTAFYRDDAVKYEKMLADNGNILSDTELAAVAKILPQKDFFIYMDSPEDNLPMLFESNPGNKRSFEYMMSWLLLEKDVETVVSNLHLLKDMGYTKIPRSIEEAILIYYNSQKKFPDMGGLMISTETLSRFDQYFSTYVKARNNPAMLQQTMFEKFGDTFWYYYHFRKL